MIDVLMFCDRRLRLLFCVTAVSAAVTVGGGDEATARSASGPCDWNHPVRGEFTQEWAYSDAILCESVDGTKFQLINKSVGTVLDVSLPCCLDSVIETGPDSLSLGNQAAKIVVPARCHLTSGLPHCYLRPGRTVFFRGAYALPFSFKVEHSMTVLLGTTEAIGGYIQAAGTSPSRKLARKIATCINGAQQIFVPSDSYTPDTLNAELDDAFMSAKACNGLANDLLGHETSPVERETVATKVGHFALEAGRASWIDDLARFITVFGRR